MPIVQLPDGTHVTIPDIPETGVPGWASDLAKYGPGFLKETGKTFGESLFKGLANLGEGASAVSGEGMRGANITNSPKPQEEIHNAIGADLPAGFFRRGVEGIGGAMSLPLPGISLPLQAAMGAAGGFGGEAGRRAGAAFSPKAAGFGDLFGSVAAGGLTGFAGGPKISVAAQDVQKALKGTTPGGFASAEANSQAARDAGSTTATGAEMFPPGSGVMALASSTRATSPDNALRLATAERPNDIQRIADEFLNRVNPKAVSPNKVADETGDAANNILAATKGVRSNQIDQALAGQSITPAQATVIQNNLGVGSRMQNSAPLGDAFREVQSALQGQHGPLTSVQDISLALKRLGKAVGNPNAPYTGTSGKAIDAVDMQQAISAAEAMINGFNPAYGAAMGDFKNFSQNVLSPLRQGPIGKLADRNPLTADGTNPSKLDSFVSNNSPTEVEGYSRALTGSGNQNLPNEIARALAQKRLAGSPINPGAAVRGTEGSPKQDALEALINAGGGDASHAMTPLAVADRLQPFAKPANMSEGPKMQGLQYLIRPFRTIDMATSGASMGKVNQEVAKLLADNSPGAIQRLQEIAMFDPNVRKMLTAKALIPGSENQ